MQPLDRRTFLRGAASLVGIGAIRQTALAQSIITSGDLNQEVLNTSTTTIDLLNNPVNYGYRDSLVSTSQGTRAVRVYFPSLQTSPSTATIRPGTYPLVMFLHGQRSSEDGSCPTSVSQDFQRWPRLVRLWARCGMVVAVPQMGNVLGSEGMVHDIYRWLHRSSPYRDSLKRISGGVIADDATHDAFLALVGHSWSASVIGAGVASGLLKASCIGLANGTWDTNEAVSGVSAYGRPKLLISGPNDEVLAAQTANALHIYKKSTGPKYIAAIQNTGHWSYSEIGYCTTPVLEPPPTFPAHAAIASELFAVFLHKFLYRRFNLPPSLMTGYGSRPSLSPYFVSGSGFALKTCWDEPFSQSQGEATRGSWTLSDPWR